MIEAVRETIAGTGAVFIGGKSMGGRMASMIADEMGVRALVCFGYPFHPPGKPAQLRTAHLETLRTPALILQGSRDPFGTEHEVSTYELSKAIRIEWLPDGSGLEDTPHLALEAAMVAASALLESGNKGVVEVPDMQCRHIAMVAIRSDTAKLLRQNCRNLRNGGPGCRDQLGAGAPFFPVLGPEPNQFKNVAWESVRPEQVCSPPPGTPDDLRSRRGGSDPCYHRDPVAFECELQPNRTGYLPRRSNGPAIFFALGAAPKPGMAERGAGHEMGPRPRSRRVAAFFPTPLRGMQLQWGREL